MNTRNKATKRFVFRRLVRKGLYVEIETANNRSIVVDIVARIYIYIRGKH